MRDLIDVGGATNRVHILDMIDPSDFLVSSAASPVLRAACSSVLRPVICQTTNDTRRSEDYRVLTPSAQRMDRVGIAKAIELGTLVSATGTLAPYRFNVNSFTVPGTCCLWRR